MAFTLPDLPYAHDALEPHIDKATMEIHHGKHHAAYVTNLNKALEGAGITESSLDALLANGCAASRKASAAPCVTMGAATGTTLFFGKS